MQDTLQMDEYAIPCEVLDPSAADVADASTTDATLTLAELFDDLHAAERAAPKPPTAPDGPTHLPRPGTSGRIRRPRPQRLRLRSRRHPRVVGLRIALVALTLITIAGLWGLTTRPKTTAPTRFPGRDQTTAVQGPTIPPRSKPIATSDTSVRTRPPGRHIQRAASTTAESNSNAGLAASSTPVARRPASASSPRPAAQRPTATTTAPTATTTATQTPTPRPAQTQPAPQPVQPSTQAPAPTPATTTPTPATSLDACDPVNETC